MLTCKKIDQTHYVKLSINQPTEKVESPPMQYSVFNGFTLQSNQDMPNEMHTNKNILDQKVCIFTTWWKYGTMHIQNTRKTKS